MSGFRPARLPACSRRLAQLLSLLLRGCPAIFPASSCVSARLPLPPLPALLLFLPVALPTGVWQPVHASPQLSPQKRHGGGVRGPRGHCPAWANTTGIFCTAVLHPGRHSADKQRQVPGRPSREQQTDQHEIPDVQASRDVLSESPVLTTAFTDLLISEGFVY